MASSLTEPLASLKDGSKPSISERKVILNDVHQDHSDTIQPFLQRAMASPMNSGGIPASLFAPVSGIHDTTIPQSSNNSWPILKPHATNNIFLYRGFFNPPHQGHLATIRYFYERRKELGITAMFIHTSPESVIRSRNKKFGDIILPEELRYNLFFQVPEVAQLVSSGWLHLLVGDMKNYIQVLRETTDLISKAGYDVHLVGLLGGDKLTVESAPHLDPGYLGQWGPIDEYLIINARRPVDFYDPKKDLAPKDLPGCTQWVKVLDIEKDIAPKNLPGCTQWVKVLDIENGSRMLEVKPNIFLTSVSSPNHHQNDEVRLCMDIIEKVKRKIEEHQGEPKDKFLLIIDTEPVTAHDLAAAPESNVGVLWTCKALTVVGKPTIQFRASESSASNGVSSTKIRQIMTEAADEDLIEGLKDKVVSVEVLVEWLKNHRDQKQKTPGGTE